MSRSLKVPILSRARPITSFTFTTINQSASTHLLLIDFDWLTGRSCYVPHSHNTSVLGSESNRVRTFLPNTDPEFFSTRSVSGSDPDPALISFFLIFNNYRFSFVLVKNRRFFFLWSDNSLCTCNTSILSFFFMFRWMMNELASRFYLDGSWSGTRRTGFLTLHSIKYCCRTKYCRQYCTWETSKGSISYLPKCSMQSLFAL